MSDVLYIDLLIQSGDFVLNTGNEPELCNNRKSIGQDIIHSIIESGLPGTGIRASFAKDGQSRGAFRAGKKR